MNTIIQNVKMAFVSIWENKVRSLLTILGVVIGVFAIITIIAIGTGLQDEIVNQIVGLGADVVDIVPGELGEGIGSAPGLQQSFSQEDVTNLRKKASMLDGVAEMYEFSGSFQFGKETVTGFILGTDPIYFRFRNKQAQAGRLFNADDNRNQARVAVIGEVLAENLFKNVEHSINQTVRINGNDFKVIGVLEKENLGFGGVNLDNAAYLPALTTQQLFPDVGIMEIFAKAKDENQINQAIKQTELVLRETRKDKKFTVLGQESILDLVDSITGVITSALAGLASVSLLVGGIGIMNIMLVSVTERTKEIGIRKAIGATDFHILVQFITESIVLCLFGGLGGLAIATVVSYAITLYYDFPTLINLETVLGAIGFSIVVGVIFGTAPALKAARKDPVQALHYE